MAEVFAFVVSVLGLGHLVCISLHTAMSAADSRELLRQAGEDLDLLDATAASYQGVLDNRLQDHGVDRHVAVIKGDIANLRTAIAESSSGSWRLVTLIRAVLIRNRIEKISSRLVRRVGWLNSLRDEKRWELISPSLSSWATSPFPRASSPLSGTLDTLSCFYSDLYKLVRWFDQIADADNTRWFFSQVRGLMTNMHDNDSPGSNPLETTLTSLGPRRQLSRTSQSSFQPLPTGRVSASLPVLFDTSVCDSAWATLGTSDGTIFLSCVRFYSAPGKCMATSWRVCILPGAGSGKTGLTLNFYRPHYPEGAELVGLVISTFQVYAKDSPIIEALRARDTAAVRDLLRSGGISANDRNEDGDTLLGCVATKYCHYGMFELLLNEKANPSDCNISGDSWQAMLFCQMAACKEPAQPENQLLNRHYQTQYQKHTSPHPGGNESNFFPAITLAGTFHIARNRTPSPGSRVTTSLLSIYQQYIESRYHLEARDVHGHTSLLYAIAYTPLLETPQIAALLLDHGADATAANRLGQGCLYILLDRLVRCRYLRHPEYTQSALSTITRLLDSGCSPDARDSMGRTPADIARSSMAVWDIFSSARRDLSLWVDGVATCV